MQLGMLRCSCHRQWLADQQQIPFAGHLGSKIPHAAVLRLAVITLA